MRAWLNYYKIADMKCNIRSLNKWLNHRIRACIWKHWKLPGTKRRNLIKLGISEDYAHLAVNSRRGYWFTSATSTVNRALSKERLIHNGFCDLSIAYQSKHVNY